MRGAVRVDRREARYSQDMARQGAGHRAEAYQRLLIECAAPGPALHRV